MERNQRVTPHCGQIGSQGGKGGQGMDTEKKIIYWLAKVMFPTRFRPLFWEGRLNSEQAFIVVNSVMSFASA